jgi:hypothetical protein
LDGGKGPRDVVVDDTLEESVKAKGKNREEM